MDTKTNTRNNTKDVFISFFTGIGVLIITFLPVTIMFQYLGHFLIDLLLPDCRDSCPDVIGFSPNVGGLIGIVAGIGVGRIIYKHRKGESVKILQRPIIVWTIIALIVIAFILSLPFLLLN